MYYSLLYPNEEAFRRSLTGASDFLPESRAGELGLTSLIPIKGSSLASFYTSDPETIKYRNEAANDLLNVDGLIPALSSVIPIINDIAELRSLERDEDGSAMSYLYSITEIELYVSCVDNLERELKPLADKFSSIAFKKLYEIVYNLSRSEYYSQLNKKLNELSARVKEVRSVTIGINLDARLMPKDGGVLTLNPQPFKSGEAIDKILRMNFKDDEYTCIAPLVPYLKSQTDNSRAAMTHAFHSAIAQIFKSSVSGWRRIVREYVLENASFFISVLPELEFFTKAATALKSLSAKGLPLCIPQIHDASEKVFKAKGLYNPSVALQIDYDSVKNDIVFDENARVYILTGPNRGGKSVVTCAVGLAQAMCQLGLPVPAESLEISPADGIFLHFPTGADDTIDKGRLGEECARLSAIFENITDKSLVLLDESLSSTGSYEASYIAKEVIAAFASLGCRTIFSTHLHELAASIDEINERVGGGVDSLVAGIDEGKRSFTITRKKPDGKSYARDIADKYGLSYEQLSHSKNL
jgi:DNA mismatch repair ATPase MutS